MLKSHLNAIEAVLISQSEIAANAGHPNLRGGPREWFIREFLQDHLPASLQIGKGEIIDAATRPPAKADWRPCPDIVLYRRDLPKIRYAEDHSAFLIEGVLGTIEVKSALTKDELLKACRASYVHKRLQKPVDGPLKVNLVSYVVAYGGPKNLETVIGWLVPIAETVGCTPADLVDGIVILGKGMVVRGDFFKPRGLTERLDIAKTVSTPVEIFQKLKDDNVHFASDRTWIVAEQESCNLFVLFAHMLMMAAAMPSPSFLHYIGPTLERGANLHYVFQNSAEARGGPA